MPILKSLRKQSDITRWALILAEFIFFYLFILLSIYKAWPYHNYLRFLMLIPMYHAGAKFGYAGNIITSMLVLFLFVPIIPLDRDDGIYFFNTTSSIASIVLYIVFGVIVGGIVGAARKTRQYIETLSNILMSILGEPDERSVMLRACSEAASLTESAGGAVLVRPHDKAPLSNWLLLSKPADELPAKETNGLPADNILVWCARRNVPFTSNSAMHDPRLNVDAPAAHIKSIIAVPVSFEDTVYGAILLTNRKNDDNYSGKDLSIAKTIADTAAGAIHNMVQEQERQEEKLREEQIRDLFSRFVSSSVADYVLEHPDLLEGRWQEVTVLVSDIRGFTSLSEKIAAHALVAQLNEYFTAMVDVIFNNKGTIDKFIGDCIIAYWGAPAPDPAHAANALRAASEMSRALDSLNASWAARGIPSFSAGIAIHTCDALMGNLGDERKKSFTIMGEEVDKTSRLESLTKTLHSKIILSETTARAVGDDPRIAPIPDAPDGSGQLFSYAME
jgi:class 3 adenylate cyclase